MINARSGQVSSAGTSGRPGARCRDYSWQHGGLSLGRPAEQAGGTAEAGAQGLLSQRMYGLVAHDQVDWLLTSACRDAIPAGWPPKPRSYGPTAGPAAGRRRSTGPTRSRRTAPASCTSGALALNTRHAAFAMHRKTEVGSLDPGKLADCTVLDQNPLDVDPEQITGIRVLPRPWTKARLPVRGHPARRLSRSPGRRDVPLTTGAGLSDAGGGRCGANAGAARPCLRPPDRWPRRRRSQTATAILSTG